MKRPNRAIPSYGRAGLVAIGLAFVVSACGHSQVTGGMRNSLLPVSLPIANADSPQAGTVVRVRVYAGADYRARVSDWEDELKRVFFHVSAIFKRDCKIQIELAETKKWKRSGGKLIRVLESLRAFDPGPDVDLVVALIDAPADHETQMAKLVLSYPLEKHLVLRSFNRQAESEALGLLQKGLGEVQEDELMTARRRHKQSIVLAHGLAHFFGAHGQSPGHIDGANYTPQLSSLSDSGAQVIAITSAAHASNEKAGSQWQLAKEKLAQLGSRAELLAIVEARHNENRVPDKRGGQSEIREEDKTRMLGAQRLLSAGKGEEAWEALEPLLELYPQQPDVANLACLVSADLGALDALAHCSLAVTLHKEFPATWLALGTLRVEASPQLALENFQEAEGLLRKEGKAASVMEWMRLAQGYKKMSMPTRAKRAAQFSVGGVSGLAKVSAVEKWATQMRIRYGVGIGMSEEQESGYLKAIQEGLALIYKQDYTKAKKVGASLAKAYPESIASFLLACELGLRRRKYAPAVRACQAVLARQPDNAWATYLLGVLDIRQGRSADGITKLQDAIRRDPQLKAAYHALASLFRKSGDEGLSALEAGYRIQFGAALP